MMKWLRIGIALTLLGSIVGVFSVLAAYVYVSYQLPSTDSIQRIELQIPLKVYSADGKLIAEYGEKKRTPVRFEDIPTDMVHAFVAAEDDRFFQHFGVDFQGLLRAALVMAKTGKKSQGGSTITMQVARNLFLSREKTFLRKISEIFAAIKIERELSKETILALYLNKIYLGNGAYGIASAAKTYYGVPLKKLSLPQIAMIAGLPKAPSAYNPLANPQRALQRRNYVLRRMRELGYIDPGREKLAKSDPITAEKHRMLTDVNAPHFAEMVRSYMIDRYGKSAYRKGFHVSTTLDSRLQAAAVDAVQRNLIDYDQRKHHYRGPEGHVDLPEHPEHIRRQLFRKHYPSGPLLPAIVTLIETDGFRALLNSGETIKVDHKGFAWTRKKHAADLFTPGDLVRVFQNDSQHWTLGQPPQVEGALVSLRPQDGAIRALVGGYDFYHSKFNRATQAKRQPGSNFKPIIYSAALKKGYTPAALINDAPIVFEDASLEAKWRPENYAGRFRGPVRMRIALQKSINLVSIRMLKDIGIEYVLDHANNFGIPTAHLPRNLSLALGSGELLPLQVATAYSTFANTGFRIAPFYITLIQGQDGHAVKTFKATSSCMDCAFVKEAEQAWHMQYRPAIRTLDKQNAYQMTSMMRSVVHYGTGRRAWRELKRKDLAGKTGTTNDQRDAWFSGFNDALVATVWVGFDDNRKLGRRETGSSAALPMWIRYMKVALDGVPEHELRLPPGMVTIRINKSTGKPARPGDPNSMFETFRKQYAPKMARHSNPGGRPSSPALAPGKLF